MEFEADDGAKRSAHASTSSEETVVDMDFADFDAFPGATSISSFAEAEKVINSISTDNEIDFAGDDNLDITSSSDFVS